MTRRVIFEISKKLDQFSLLKKLLLNEGQCLLLNNRELKIINEKTLEVGDVTQDKLNEVEMINYIKSRKENNQFSQVDNLLVKYLPECIKDKIDEINK